MDDAKHLRLLDNFGAVSAGSVVFLWNGKSRTFGRVLVSGGWMLERVQPPKQRCIHLFSFD
jgi:hypothetical protein